MHTPLEISQFSRVDITLYPPCTTPCKLQVGEGWEGTTTFRFFNQRISLSTVTQKLTNLIGLYYPSSLSIQTSFQSKKRQHLEVFPLHQSVQQVLSHFNLFLKLIFLLHEQRLLGRLGGEKTGTKAIYNL